MMARLAIEAAVRYLRGENVPREIMLLVEIVDRAHSMGADGRETAMSAWW